jgi:hypothetical protein
MGYKWSSDKWTLDIGKSAAFGADSVFRTGAPRRMKMGTTRSLWRYDAPKIAPKSALLRRHGRLTDCAMMKECR